MPTQNQEVLFDKNRFTMAFLDLGMSRERFANAVDALKQYISNGKIDDLNLIKDEKTVKNNSKAIYQGQKDEDFAYISNLLYEFYKNPQNPQIANFYQYWDFIRPIFVSKHDQTPVQQILMILNKINIFDGDVQIKLLRFIKNKYQLDTATIKNIHIKIAANENATAFDRAEAAEKTKDPNICRDAIESLKNELSNEMGKDFPDSGTLHAICNYANSVCMVLEEDIFKKHQNGFYANNDPEYQYIQMVRAEFNINKILSAGAEYVPQIQQSLEERLIAAEQRAKKAEEELNVTRNALQIERENAQKQIQNEQQKNTLLTQQMDAMQQQINVQSSWIKTAKMRAATLKTGLFNGSDLKKYQDFMHSGPEY